MKRFKGKTVIVMGAGSGIGRATAIRFGKEGANVVLVGRTQQTLEETAAELPQDNTWIHGDNHLTVTCDITEQSQVKAMVSHAVQMFKQIDIVVNNAGEAIQRAKPDISVTDVKSNGYGYVCQAVMPEIIKTKGNIINVTSLSGLADDWTVADYNAAKESVVNLTQSLALKYGENGVQVNAVEAVNTGFSVTEEASFKIQNDDETQQFLQRCPLKRLATPEDIAAVITFLASEDATMITGINIPVDGGFSLRERQTD